jgi:hypothetical protein
MRHMERIPAKELGLFVAQQMRLNAPVFWRLVPPLEGVVHFEQVGEAARRADSNTLEVSFPTEVSNAIEVGRRISQEDIVRRYAEPEDPRNFRVTEGAMPSGVSFELESDVPTDDGANGTLLRVIGPGGRATAFSGVSGLTGLDVTIRRRGRAERGVWRRRNEIMRPLEQVLADEFGAIEDRPTTRAAFGYFELSKYERQILMRPVFLFVIEQDQDPEGRWPGFQRIVVSPATTAGDFNDSEGLGMWAQSMLCSG